MGPESGNRGPVLSEMMGLESRIRGPVSEKMGPESRNRGPVLSEMM